MGGIIINHNDHLREQDDLLFRAKTDINLSIIDCEHILLRNKEELNYKKNIKSEDCIKELKSRIEIDERLLSYLNLIKVSLLELGDSKNEQ